MGDSVERLTCGLWASLGSQEASFLGWTKDPFLAAVALRKILQLLCMSGSRCPCLLVLRGRRGRGKPGSLLFRGTRGAESDSLVFPPPSASTPPLSIDPQHWVPECQCLRGHPQQCCPSAWSSGLPSSRPFQLHFPHVRLSGEAKDTSSSSEQLRFMQLSCCCQCSIKCVTV